jgi:hypothetical protein
MSQRERSDSDIRASMFNSLMANYLGSLSSDGGEKHPIEDYQRKIVFLNLLINNFQEYFNARPLFEDLYNQISIMSRTQDINGSEKERIDTMKGDLIDISRSAAKKQEAMLSWIGTSTDVSIEKGNHACISLYDTSGLKMRNNGAIETFDGLYESSCTEAHKTNPGKTEADMSTLPVEGGGRKASEYKEENYNYSLELIVTEIKESEIELEMTVYRDYFQNDFFDHFAVESNDIGFSVSYFDLPFMDNTRLFSGSRFAVTLLDVDNMNKEWAEIGVISFREEFMSLRDRPFFEEMLNRLQTDSPSDT